MAPLALRTRILAETGTSVSLDQATSPLLAKMASEQAKQRADHVSILGSCKKFLPNLRLDNEEFFP